MSNYINWIHDSNMLAHYSTLVFYFSLILAVLNYVLWYFKRVPKVMNNIIYSAFMANCITFGSVGTLFGDPHLIAFSYGLVGVPFIIITALIELHTYLYKMRVHIRGKE